MSEKATLAEIKVTGRLDYIDVAKAIGIIAVMISHSIGFPFNTGYLFTASYMALFFVLSGYTVKLDRKMSDSISRRTRRIGSVYFFYNICLYIMSVTSKVVFHGTITREYLLTAVAGIFYSTNAFYYPRTIEPNIYFLIIHNAPLWYLTCFIIAGLYFDIAIKIASNNNKRIVGVIIIGTTITYLLADIPIRLPWGMDTAFAGMTFMVFGYWLRRNDILSKIKRWYFLIVLLVAYTGLCIWNPGIAMSVREYGDYGVFSSIAFIVIGCLGAILYILLAQFFCKCSTVKKIMCCIGKKTLPILAFHVFIFTVWDVVVEKILYKLGITLLGDISYWLVGGLKIIFTVMVCIVGSYCWNMFSRGRKGEKFLYG